MALSQLDPAGMGSAPSGPAPAPNDLQSRAQSFVSEKWRELKQAYLVYHQKIWECRLFYSGQMWVDLDSTSKFWRVTEPADDFVPQPRINRFSAAVDAIASNFSSIPEVEAVAVPKDDEVSMAVASIANELAEHCFKDNALRADYKSDEDKAGYAAQELVLSGSVFTVVYPSEKKIGERPQTQLVDSFSVHCPQCDLYQRGLPAALQACPQCGGPVESIAQQEEQPVMGPDGAPAMQPVMQPQVKVAIGDPGHAFPRPGARNMGQTPYMVWAERFSLDEIFERWGIEATADAEQPDGFSITYQHSLDFWYQGYSSATIQSKDGALVVQCFIEPGKMKDWPEGLYAVMIGQKVEIAEPWPFAEHPLSKGDYLQLPTVFFGRSVSFDLVELQREKNSYESMIKLHGMTSAADPVVVDENTVVSEITGRADKVIRWRSIGPGSKEPHRMQHGALDPKIYEKIEKIDLDFQTISAAVSVFRGEQPGSITAASAIQTLRGQAELQFAKPVQNWNNLWKETVRKVIKNYQATYSLPQLAEILGAEKVPELEMFLQADLDTCLDYIATSAGLPKTRDERRQEMLELFDRGALDINDPQVKEKVFELFGETGLMASFNDDARRMRLNIRRMKQGVPVEFRPGIDDTGVHLGIALEAAKSLDFDRWPPESQQLLIQYIMNLRTVQALETPPPQSDAPPSDDQAPAPSSKKPGGRQAKPVV